MVSKLGGLDLTLPQGAHPLAPLIWTRVIELKAVVEYYKSRFVW